MILFKAFFPLPGEHILSWLLRLAEANGFHDFTLFCEMFIFDGDIVMQKRMKSFLDTGFDFPMGNLLKHFLPDFAEKISAEGILHQNTLYNLYVPFMSKEVQAQFKEYFYNNSSLAMKNPLKLREEGICYCPECLIADSKEYGFPYIHLAHQVRGVYVCHKHGTFLYNCNVMNGEIEFAGENTKAISTRIFRTGENKKFAIMCKDLLDNGWNCSMSVLENSIKNAINTVFSGSDSLFLHTVDDTGMLDDVEFLSYMRWNKNDTIMPESFVKGKNKIDVNKVLVILYVLFDNASRVRSVINNNGRLNQKENLQIRINNITREYTVEKTENRNKNLYVSLRHTVCGNINEYSMKEFMNGKRCPHCQKTITTEIIESELLDIAGTRLRIIGKTGNNSYEVRDTETGERFILSGEKLLQEIKRPFLSPVLNIPYSGIERGKERQMADDITIKLRELIKQDLPNKSDKKKIKETIQQYVSRELPPECYGLKEEISYRLNYFFSIQSSSILRSLEG